MLRERARQVFLLSLFWNYLIVDISFSTPPPFFFQGSVGSLRDKNHEIWADSERSCSCVLLLSKNRSICVRYKSDKTTCGMIPKGTLFGNLAEWEAVVSNPQQCSCPSKFKDLITPSGYTAAYNVYCRDSLTGPLPEVGLKWYAKMYERDATVSECAERCDAVPGCGGFRYSVHDNGYSGYCSMMGQGLL